MIERQFDITTLAYAKTLFDKTNRYSIVIGKLTGNKKDIEPSVVDFYFDNELDNWVSIIDTEYNKNNKKPLCETTLDVNKTLEEIIKGFKK